MANAKPKNSGQFGKGNPGKPKGATNKTSRELKDMILTALSQAGGEQYLLERALDPRTASAFMSLVGKVLPMQVTGANGMPLVARVELIPMEAKKE